MQLKLVFNKFQNFYIMKKILFVFSFLLLCSKAFADSPITSTEFALAYQDQPIVAQMLALNGEAVTYELIEYLADDNNPIDVKVAAINAVSISKDVYTPLMQHLKNKYETDSEITVLANVNVSTHTALTYARARHYYMDLGEAFILGYSASIKDGRSFTVNMVYALILSTEAMDYDFATVYRICDSVVTNDSLVQDMRPEAISMMMEYINLYKE